MQALTCIIRIVVFRKLAERRINSTAERADGSYKEKQINKRLSRIPFGGHL